MPEWFNLLLDQAFLRQALFAGVLASLGCGLIGPFVVVKRLTFLAGGISHSVLAGLGAAVYIGANPLWGALIAAVIAALLIGTAHLAWHTREDTAIGAIWAVGMAIGLLFLAHTPGYATDLMSFLFGNILLVPTTELQSMAVLDIGLLIIVLLFYRQFVAVIFDEEFARLRRLPVTTLYLLLLVLIAVTTVLMIQVVGLILVIALLTLPAATAAHWTTSLHQMMISATLLGVALTTSGLILSFYLNWPTGPTIIIVAGTLYLVTALTVKIRKITKRYKSNR
jgi:zinc transport system permease protein